MRLPHRLFRSDGILDPDGPASLGGGADASSATREGVSEASDMVVLGTSGPWNQPYGPTVFLAVRRVNNPWNRPETTEIHYGSSSSPSSPSWPGDEDLTADAAGLRHGPQPWMAHRRP
jgi:hypothetical protein